MRGRAGEGGAARAERRTPRLIFSPKTTPNPFPYLHIPPGMAPPYARYPGPAV